MLIPECGLDERFETDESLPPILALRLGRSVGSECAPSVITFWAKEPP